MKLSEAQIKIVKLETELELKQTSSTSASVTPSRLDVTGETNKKRDVETQTDTVHRQDTPSQTDSKAFKNKASTPTVTIYHSEHIFENFIKIKTEPRVGMVNIANSKTSSKKRKRSKSKSILKTSRKQAESLDCSTDSATVFSEGI